MPTPIGAGVTASTDFPTTLGAIQPSYGGGPGDAFLVSLDGLGRTATYATYLGGIGTDQGVCIDKNAAPDPTFKCEGDPATLLPNRQGIVYNEAQAGYLVGVLAAGITKSGFFYHFKDKGELAELFATTGYPSPIGIAIFPDLSEPTRYGVYAGQGSILVTPDSSGPVRAPRPWRDRRGGCDGSGIRFRARSRSGGHGRSAPAPGATV